MTEKSDLDAQFAFVIVYVQEWFRREEELVPSGATMSADGECAHLFVSPELRDPRPVREILTEGLRNMAEAGNVRAAVLCVQVVLAPPGEPKFDAIMFYLEHARGLALQVVVPIRRTETGEMAYAPARASRGVPNTFFPVRPLQ
jgi:hypothetical protein